MKTGDRLIGDYGNKRAVLTVQPTGIRVVLYRLPQEHILFESHMPLEENFDYAKERALAFFMCELPYSKRDEVKRSIQWSTAAAAGA